MTDGRRVFLSFLYDGFPFLSVKRGFCCCCRCVCVRARALKHAHTHFHSTKKRKYRGPPFLHLAPEVAAPTLSFHTKAILSILPVAQRGPVGGGDGGPRITDTSSKIINISQIRCSAPVVAVLLTMGGMKCQCHSMSITHSHWLALHLLRAKAQ